jgi:type VI secretion system secreted protein Hcp
MSKASPKLMQQCAEGKHIPDATLTCRRAGGSAQEYLKIKLTDCIISSYQTGGSANGQVVPTDQFSLNFAKLEFEYAAQDAKGAAAGTVKGQYDFEKNKA